MNLEEIKLIILKNKEFKNLVIDKLEVVNDKYNCTLLEKIGTKTYRHSSKQEDTEDMALEKALLNVNNTGGLNDLELPKIEKSRKKKESKKVIIESDGEI